MTKIPPKNGRVAARERPTEAVALREQLVGLMADRIIYEATTRTSMFEEISKLLDSRLQLTPGSNDVCSLMAMITLEKSQNIPRCLHCGRVVRRSDQGAYLVHLSTHSISCEVGDTEAEL